MNASLESIPGPWQARSLTSLAPLGKRYQNWPLSL